MVLVVSGLCCRVGFTLQLFFAKVLRSATEEEVKTLFSRFGKVYDVNLFRAFQGAPTTKVSGNGCRRTGAGRPSQLWYAQAGF
jgi:hypothetical protein